MRCAASAPDSRYASNVPSSKTLIQGALVRERGMEPAVRGDVDRHAGHLVALR